jgi:hypothetical protein
MEEHEKLAKARQKVEAMTGFYAHLAVFVFVMALLFAINASVGKVWWVQWPLIGWGAGVLAHAAIVFGAGPSFVRDWQLRKIKELKDKM